jgi:hypothetical protein
LSCILKKLLNSQDKNPLLKLKHTHNPITLSLEPQTFPCCLASGQIHNANYIEHCSLNTRFKRTSLLVKQFFDTWPKQQLKLNLTDENFDLAWKWLIQNYYHRVYKGQTIVQNEIDLPSSIWPIAFMASWRFNLPSIIYTLGKTNFDFFINTINTYNSTHKIAPIVFVEQSSPLWKLHLREEFSYIINWCEHSLTSLWLSLPNNNSNNKSSNPAMQQFSQRIANKKYTHPLRWITQGQVSKLTSITNGFEIFLPR